MSKDLTAYQKYIRRYRIPLSTASVYRKPKCWITINNNSGFYISTSRFAASACGGPRAYGPRSTGLRPVSGPPACGRWARIRALRAQMKPAYGR